MKNKTLVLLTAAAVVLYLLFKRKATPATPGAGANEWSFFGSIVDGTVKLVQQSGLLSSRTTGTGLGDASGIDIAAGDLTPPVMI